MRYRYPAALLLSCCLLLGTVVLGQAQALRGPQLDSLVGHAMRTFQVPGLALVIVQNGQVVCAKGYGVRVAGTRQAVDAHTLFAIASNSKAFTAAALGMLVSEGKLQWDDKVIDYLPEFRLRDPWVTADFTVRDLLTHRSGLALQAGDLMRTPDSTRFTMADIMHNLRYLPLVAPFRSRYAYDNILYLVAGELVARVSGQSWDDFIERRLLAPLQMRESRAAFGRIQRNPNVALGHQLAAGSPRPIPGPLVEQDAGAGGIYSSAAELSHWLLLQLGHGRAVAGPRLYSEAVANEMWTPQTIVPASPNGPYHTHFGAYGLGWFLVDVKGQLEVFHTGQDVGMVSAVTLLPELGVGFAVLSNQEGGGAVYALTDQLTDAYLGIRGTNRVQEYATEAQRHAAAAEQARAAVLAEVTSSQRPAASGLDPSPYVGTYRDPWFGEVRISARPAGGGLWFQALRSPQLRGPLVPYRGTTFVARWTTPGLNADAFVIFSLGAQGQATGLRMQALSPMTAPAFDFQDLLFQRLTP